jgi:LacI family transcriptional regulator
MFDKVLYTDEYSTVTIDDKEAAYIATCAILEKQRKNIVGIFGHQNLSITKNRLNGFEKALNQYGLLLNEKNHLLFNSLNDLKIKLNDNDLINSIDGLFFMTDELLVNSLNTFLKINKKIPEDISVVAFSDGSSPYFLYPNISHIFHSGFLVGQSACELLFDMIVSGNLDEIQHKLVGTHLIDLGSI